MAGIAFDVLVEHTLVAIRIGNVWLHAVSVHLKVVKGEVLGLIMLKSITPCLERQTVVRVVKTWCQRELSLTESYALTEDAKESASVIRAGAYTSIQKTGVRLSEF